LYLKKIEILPIPASPFRFTNPKSILISRNATVKELKSKIIRVLNSALYSLGNKSLTYQKAKIFKFYNNNVEEILHLEKK